MKKFLFFILILLAGVGVCEGAAVTRYVKYSATSAGDGTTTTPWRLLSDIKWTTGSANNVQDDIDAGNQVTICLYGGESWGVKALTTTGQPLTVGYGGASDAVRVIIDGLCADWNDGTGTKALIDNTVTALSAGWTACDGTVCPAGVYYYTIPNATPTFFHKNTKDNAGLLRVKGGRITAATQANPVEITTASSHYLETGDTVVIADVAGMTELNGNTYTVTYVSGTKVTLGVDGTLYGEYTNSPRSGLVAGTLNESTFVATTGYTKVYYRPTSGAPGDETHTMYIAARDTGVSTNAKNYVTLKNLDVRGSTTAAINLSGTDALVQKNDLSFSYSGVRIIGNGAAANVVGGSAGNGNTITNVYGDGGIYHLGSSTNVTTSTISYNTLHDGMNNNYGGDRNAIGVNCVGGGSGVLVEHNTIYNWGPIADAMPGAHDSAISVATCASTTVKYNLVYDNYIGCLYFQTNSNNGIAAYNVCRNNGRETGTALGWRGGIVLGTSTGLVAVHNIVCDSGDASGYVQNASLYLKGTGSGSYDWTIKNNIFCQPATGYTVATTNGDTFTAASIANNIFEGTGDVFRFDSADNDYSEFVTKYSIPNTNVNADPVVTSTTDYRLRPASPGKNTGVNICTGADAPLTGCTGAGTGTYTDYLGHFVPQQGTPDMGAYEYMSPNKNLNLLWLGK